MSSLGEENINNQPFDEAHEVEYPEDIASNLADTPDDFRRNITSHKEATHGSSNSSNNSRGKVTKHNNRSNNNMMDDDRGDTPPKADDSRLSSSPLLTDSDEEGGLGATLHNHDEDMMDGTLRRDEYDDGRHGGDGGGRGGHRMGRRQTTMSDPPSDEDDDDDSASPSAPAPPTTIRNVHLAGGYDPRDYDNLDVSADISELFSYISRYTPQTGELDTKLKPFIPDFIPAVGDIDAMIKVGRPDKVDPLGLGTRVLDEPCAAQSDPTVLDLQLRAISKTAPSTSVAVKQVKGDGQLKAIDNWITSIAELHREKPPQSVDYTTNMPDIDKLMQEWPPEFEALLGKAQLPSADLNVSLKEYVSIVCALVDIPIHKSRIESLHLLFTLFSEFRNSQHFKSKEDDNEEGGDLEAAGSGEPDVLALS